MEKFPSHAESGEKDMGAPPAHIQRARLEGNTDLLKAAGRQGGIAAGAKRRRAKDIDALYADRRAEQGKAHRHLG